MIRTIAPSPRIYGRVAVYTVVDEHLRYVRVYVPFRASSMADIERTINFALDSRPALPPREVANDG